jgi:hypothetical protein
MHGPYRWTSGVESISAHTEDERLEREEEASKADRLFPSGTDSRSRMEKTKRTTRERGEKRQGREASCTKNKQTNKQKEQGR